MGTAVTAASDRPTTAPVRPASLFRDPWLNNNPILLEYLSQAELEKHQQPAAAGGAMPAAVNGAAAGPGGGDGASSQLELPDGSTAGVVSLRRPLVERLRMTAAAMEESAGADVASLVASSLFSGGEGTNGSDAAAELRELILAVQDLTAERDDARAALAKRVAAEEAGGEAAELTALREENATLRAENANMFTLMEENANLRSELEMAKLTIECSVDAQ